MSAKPAPRVNDLKAGPPPTPAADIGPLVAKLHFNKVAGHLDTALRRDGTCPDRRSDPRPRPWSPERQIIAKPGET